MTGERDFLVGKRVTVLGLGIEGVDVARYAAAHGASVTVIDAKAADALTSRLRELEGLPITYALGQHGADLVAESDLVFASQSIPLSAPPLAAARSHSIRLTSMTQWFFEHCPGPTIGITGSSGKTTTTSLVGAMLEARRSQTASSAGTSAPACSGSWTRWTRRTWAVVEISHTQLQLLDRSPHIAAVLNVTPNHLDRFSWEEYVALKRRLVRYQAADDYVVLNCGRASLGDERS